MAEPWLTDQFAKYHPKTVVYELKIREVKSGSRWKYKRSSLEKLTSQQYVYSAGDKTAKWFGARRSGKYFPFGYYPGTFSSLSPDKKERDRSEYYSEDQLESVLKFKIKPDTKIGAGIKRRK